jgi:hypothetical protein
MTDLVTQQEVTDAWAAFASLPAARKAQLITAASRAVERYCDRTFASGTVTDTIDGDNSPRVFLSRPPITSITSVTVNGSALDNTYGDAWSFNPDTGELLRGDGKDDPRFATWFPRGFRNVVVVFVGGYSSIPEDVKEATIETVKHMHDLAKKTGVYQSEAIGDYSYTLADPTRLALPPLAQMLLSSYRLHSVI